MTHRNNEWSIDKHIPVALILAILVQTGVGVWWASGVNSLVNANTVRISKLERRADENSVLTERIIRLEVRQESANELLIRIENKLSGK